MNVLREPGVLGDHWPWGPPVAVVVIPRAMARSYCDMTFVITRSSEDTQGRPYREVEGRWSTATILTRAEAPTILDDLMPKEYLVRILREIDRALSEPVRGGNSNK